MAQDAASGSDRPARWNLSLLGRFGLSAAATGEKLALSGKRERVLLAYLALSPHGRASRRKLTALLWGSDSDDTTLENLRVCVWSLRKAFGGAKHQVIASEGEDIVLDLASVEVDVLSFRRLAAAHATDELEAAAKLYAGEFLEELHIESEEFESWRRVEAARCKNQILELLTGLMNRLEETGETARAIDAGLRILRLEPLHEAAVRRLMQLYGESGRRGPAIALYRSLADSLKSELDAQPEAETRALFAEIARGSEEWAPHAIPARSEPPPVTAAIAARHTSGARRETSLRYRSRAIVGSLAATLILAALLSYPQLVRLSAVPPGAAGASGSASQASVVSIAVLPFANLSGDASQDFFSQGMTEEITTVLARIPDLRVVARTSAFQFKGENTDIRAVGQALGATHLIEGSVRKAGEQLRVTAQLIKADDGTHLWAEAYDRELRDVFAIQEDIAQAIAAALRTQLGLKPGERRVSSRGIDPESYQQFLRARPLIRARIDGVSQAVKILEQVVARNPDYAPAWALLAISHAFINAFDPETALREFLPKADMEARRAIQLDPNLADGYLALGRVQRLRGKLIEADELFLKALALDPSNPDVLDLYMLHLSNVGRLKDALAVAQQLRALEPYVPAFNADVGLILWETGQTDAAIAMLTPLIGFSTSRANLAMIYASIGRYEKGVDMLEAEAAYAVLPQNYREGRRIAADILRTAPKASPSAQSLPRFIERVSHLDFVYLYVGAPERALETYEDTVKTGQVGGQGGSFAYLWHPSYAPVRKTERFKAFVRDAGMVEYWRAKTWPEFCRPTTGDDFACS